MSVCDRRGVQLDPGDLSASPHLDPEDAWLLGRAATHDDRLPEDERVRLLLAVLDAARFGMPEEP